MINLYRLGVFDRKIAFFKRRFESLRSTVRKKKRRTRKNGYADQVFISMCEDILENGTSTEGEKVRPHWPDGESAYTIKQFGVVIVTICPKNFQH